MSSSQSKETDQNLVGLVSNLSLNVGPKKCHYCGLDNERTECLVKCNDCSLYFCNEKGRLQESHIVHHLIRAEHNSIDINMKRVVGDSKSCNLCGSKNVFELGYITSNEDNRYLLCRPTCKKSVEEVKTNNKVEIIQKPFFNNSEEYFETLGSKLPYLCINGTEILNDDGVAISINRSNFESVNISEWKPFITSEKILIDFIVQRPEYIDSFKCEAVSADEIERIERELDQTRKKPNEGKSAVASSILICEEDLLKVVEKPVLLVYENGKEYRDIFHHLMSIENHFQRLTDKDDFGLRISYDRANDALNNFRDNSKNVNDEIYQVILGKSKIKSPISDEQLFLSEFTAPNLPELNQSQALAVKHALENPFTLIQGPPGTGKTVTLASIVYQLSKKQSINKEQILVCAPSNIACDHMAAKIHETGLNVVRLLSRKKEEDKTYKHSPLSINKLLEHPDLSSEYSILMNNLIWKFNNKVPFLEFEIKKLRHLRHLYSDGLLNKADVIVVTCNTSADKRLTNKIFKYILVDEVAQSTETDLLIALNHYNSCQKLILIGDIQQLGPVIKNKAAVNAGFDQSLIQRLTTIGNYTFMLDTQYRMHPIISQFPNEHFYKGLLKNGVTEKDRILNDSTFKWPNDKQNFFFSCKEEEQISVSGHSYLNAKEGYAIGKLVFKLINSGVKPDQIGIITPYEGQRSYLRINLKFFSKTINYDEIDIVSINSYQGKEKDIIIFSTVRSNLFEGKRSIGFLADVRRLNVALTRAKYGLIIVGDESTLCNEQVWYELIKFYENNKMIYTGSVDDLVHLDCNLRRPTIFDEACFELKNNYHFKRVNPDNEIVEYFKI